MGIKSTSNCIEMADKQLGYNCWFLFQQCVYMASNAKKKYKSCLNISKKHLGRGNFVLLVNLFPCFRDHHVVSKLKTRFMPLSTCKLIHNFYISVSFSYYFRFLLFESKSNVKFCHNNFSLLIVSHYH